MFEINEFVLYFWESNIYKMKKTILLFSLIFTLFAVKAQDKKVAVVTFNTDKIIGFSDLGIGSEEMLTKVLKLRDNPDFDLTPILEKFHTKFFNKYSKEFPFKILDEKVVLSNEDYKAYIPKFEKSEEALKRFAVYEGYKLIHEGFMGKANEVAVANIFKDSAQGVMFVTISFDLVKGFGLGGVATVKMRAKARIALYNSEGKNVYVIKEGANSKKSSVMVKGIPVMSTKKILPMCESASEKLMKDLKKKLPKIIRKTSKL